MKYHAASLLRVPYWLVAIPPVLLAGPAMAADLNVDYSNSPYSITSSATYDTLYADDNGTINHTAGTINATTGYIGYQGAIFSAGQQLYYGIYNLSGSAVLNATNLTVGYGVYFDPFTGNTVHASNGSLNISGNSAVNVSQSLFISNQGGIGAVNQNGGTVVAPIVIFGTASNNLASGTYNLNGGTLSTGAIYKGTTNGGGGTAPATFIFNGGTLRATASNFNFINSGINILAGAGGAVIDNNGFDLNLPSLNHDPGAGGTDGGLTKKGAGLLYLAGNNTFNGNVSVQAGTLSVSAGANLGAGTNTLSLTGGSILQITGDDNSLVNLNSGSHALVGSTFNGGFDIVSATKVFTVGQALTNSSSTLVKNGLGTLVLGGVNTYTGATTINAGTLKITGSIASSATTTVGAGTSLILAGTTYNLLNQSGLTIQPGGTLTSAGTASNSTMLKNFTLDGATINSTTAPDAAFGNFILNGTATVNQTTVTPSTISAAVVELNGTGVNAPVFDLHTSGAQLTISSALTDTNYNPVTHIYGSAGGLSKIGPGTLILTGVNSYSGGTTVSAGSLVGNTDSLVGSILNNAAVTLNQPSSGIVGTGIYAGAMSGTGSLTKTGAGSVTLTGVNSYSGGTTISAGSLIGNTDSLQRNITDNANLTFDQPASGIVGTGIYGGAISGTGTVTKTGAGTATFSQENTFTGGTTVNAGTLATTTADGTTNGALGAGNIVVNNGGTISVNGSNSLNGTGHIASGTSTIQINSGGAITTASSSSHLLALVLNGGTLSATTANAISGNWILDNGVSTLGNGRTSTISGGNLALTQAGGTIFDIGAGDTLSISSSIGHFASLTDTGLIKNGAGLLSLSGTNTFTGPTILNAGILSIDGNDALSPSSPVTFAGGSLQFTNGGSFSGPISNAPGQAYAFDTNGQDTTLTFPLTSSGGTLVKTGLGTLTLSGANTYDGHLNGPGLLQATTEIKAGTLAIPTSASLSGGLDLSVGAASGDLAQLSISGGSVSNHIGSLGSVAGASGTATVTDGSWTNSAGLRVGDGGTGTLTLSGGTISGAGADSIGTQAGSHGSATITGGTWTSVRLTVGDTGTGTLDLSGTGAISGTGIIGAQSGSTGTANISGGTWTAGTLTVGDTGTGTLNLSGVGAISATGTIGAQSGSVGTANVSGGTWTTDVLTIGNAGAGTLNLTGTGAVNASGAITLAAQPGSTGTLSLGTGSTAGTLSATEVTGGSGTAAVIFKHSDPAYTFGTNLSGSLSASQTGSGTTILTGTGTWTGGTTISAGVLRAGSATALPDDTAYAVNGGTLDLDGHALTMSAISGSAGTIALGSAALTIDSATPLAFGGVIQGPGSLVKSGSGALTLSGANLYSGGTTVSGGSLIGTTTSLQGDIGNNANVTFAQLSDGAYAGTMTGTGTLTKTGSAALTLAGANTYSGGTTISSGSLIGNTSSLQGAITNNAALIFLQDTDGEYAGALDGTGSLVKSGLGNLQLSGANTFGGGTTISAGTLTLGSATALGTGSVSISSGAVLDAGAFTLDLTRASGGGSITGSGTYAYASDGNASFNLPLGGTAGLTKSGLGNLTLANTNTYSGLTTISAGALTIGDFGALGTGPVTVASGATLDSYVYGFDLTRLSGPGTLTGYATFTYNSSADRLVDTILAGAAPLTKDGTGTLTLTGANTFGGGTSVHGGTLTMGNAAALGTGSASIDQGATLDTSTYGADLVNVFGGGTLTGSGVYTYDSSSDQSTFLSLAGTGRLVKDGTGRLSLGGASTHSGGNTISNGTLLMANASALGTGDTFVDAAGTLDTSSYGFDLAKLTGTGTVTGSGTYTYGATTDADLTNLLTGTARISKSGPGTLTLSAANSYSGGTTISAGTLAQDNASALGSGGIFVDTDGTLDTSSYVLDLTRLSGPGTVTGTAVYDYDSANSAAVAATLSGTASLTKENTGTLTLTGPNSYTGGTTVTAGTLAGNSTSLQGDILNDAAVTFTQDADGTYAGTMSGTGSLLKAGLASLTLSGPNSYSGGTEVQSGTLLIGHATALGTGVTTIDSGATLDSAAYGLDLSKVAGPGTLTGTGIYGYDSASDATVSTPLAGTASVSKSGTGTLTISAANSYSGGTTISQGTLLPGNDSAFGTGLVHIASGGTLGGAATLANAVTVDGTISPGNTPGSIATLTTGDQTWNAGGAYHWEISDSGSDQLAINGTLTIASTAATPFTLTLDSLGSEPIGFSPYQDFSWTIATTTGGIDGFASDRIAIDASGFVTSMPGGVFSLATSATDLILSYTGLSHVIDTPYHTSIGGAITMDKWLVENDGTTQGEVDADSAGGLAGGAVTFTGGSSLQASVNGAIVDGTQNFRDQSTLVASAANALSGGIQNFQNTSTLTVTASQGLTGGVQNFHDSSTFDASLPQTITGGVQNFDGQAKLTASAAQAVSAGTQNFSGTAEFDLQAAGSVGAFATQNFHGQSSLHAGVSGALTAGHQNFYDTSTLEADATAAIGNGSTVTFTNQSVLDASVDQAIAGGSQTFYESSILKARHAAAISGGSQAFYGSSRLQASADGAITGGTQGFHGDSVLEASADGAVSGGSQTFGDTSGLEASETGALNGGTQVFNNGSSLTASATGAVSGGTQDFYNSSQLIISAPGSITGGTQSFHGTMNVPISSTNALNGGTQNFYDTTSLTATAASAIAGGNQNFLNNSVLHAAAAGSVNGASISLSDSAKILVETDDALGASTNISFGSGFGIALDLQGHNATVGAVSSTSANGTIRNTDPLLTASLTLSPASGTTTFRGLIQDGAGSAPLAIVKSGAGTQVLTAANTYSGGTAINGGTLFVGNSSALGTGAVTIAHGGTLAGGQVVTANAISVSGTLSVRTAAGAPSFFYTGAETWNGGGTYDWNITEASSSFSTLMINGSLALNGTATNKFTIAPDSGGLAVANFDPYADYSFPLASTTGGIVGFDPANFRFDVSAFDPAAADGSFSISSDGSSLQLLYAGAAHLIDAPYSTTTLGAISTQRWKVENDGTTTHGEVDADSPYGVSGGTTTFLGASTLRSSVASGVAGGAQIFHDTSTLQAAAATSVSSGTQNFYDSSSLNISAAQALSSSTAASFHDQSTLTFASGSIGAGAQSFQDSSSLQASVSGAVNGGQQTFGGDSSLVASVDGAIVGGSQTFNDNAHLDASVTGPATQGAIAGGTQEFHGTAYLEAGAHAIGGGNQTFYDDSELEANAAGAITGGTQNLRDTSALSATADGAITDGSQLFYDSSHLDAGVTGASTLGAVAGGIQRFNSTSSLQAGAHAVGGGIQFFNDTSYLSATAAQAITGGEQIFNNQSHLDATVANAVTGGSMAFTDSSTLNATVPGAVTGGSMTFSGSGTLNAQVAGSVNGASLTFPSGTVFNATVANSLGAATTIALNGGAVQLDGFDTTVGAISNSFGTNGVVRNGSATVAAVLTLSPASGLGSFSGLIEDGTGSAALSLHKTGAGSILLSGSGTYTGGTTISGGTLLASGTSSPLGTGLVAIAPGGTLAGGATLANPISVSGTIAPRDENGNTAQLTTGDETWAGGGIYQWSLTNVTSYSSLTINGDLTLANTAADKFTIALDSKGTQPPDFDPYLNYTWTIASVTGAITGFDPANFSINSTGFVTSISGGTFSLSGDGGAITLSYTGVAHIIDTSYTISTDGAIGQGNWKVENDGTTTHGVVNVDSFFGITGGTLNFLGGSSMNVTTGYGVSGGTQNFHDTSVLNAAAISSIYYGTRQNFYDHSALAISAGSVSLPSSVQSFYDHSTLGFTAGSIGSGSQTFHNDSSLLASIAGSVDGGAQDFEDDSSQVASVDGAITGGTQVFQDSALLDASVTGPATQGAISGGTQDFHGTSSLRARAGAIGGGTQTFHDTSSLVASADAAIIGGTQKFDDSSVLDASVTGASTQGAIASGNQSFHDTSHLEAGAHAIGGGSQTFLDSSYLNAKTANAVNGGNQTFYNTSELKAVATGVVTAGTQSFQDTSLLSATADGAVAGGSQDFYSSSHLDAGIVGVSTSGAVTGGTATFHDTSYLTASAHGIGDGASLSFRDNSHLDAGAVAAVQGGSENFSDSASLNATAAGAVSGGTQSFSGQSSLNATVSGAVTGGTMVFEASSVLHASAPGSVNGASLTFGSGTTFTATIANSLGANTSVALDFSTFQLDGFDTTIGSVTDRHSYNAGEIVQNGSATTAATLTLSPATGSTIFLGTIQDGGTAALAFTKTGQGRTELSGANTYTGGTTISGGTLVASNDTALGTGLVTITAGGTLVSGQDLANEILVGGAIASGTPDQLPRTFATGSETWQGGGSDLWKINDAQGTGGVNWDLLTINGALDITSTALDTFSISVTSLSIDMMGQIANFDPTVDQSWIFATATGGITGFDPAAFRVDTTSFQNATNPGSHWDVTQNGNSLQLNYSAVPEPGTWLLIALGLGTLGCLHRRVRPSVN